MRPIQLNSPQIAAWDLSHTRKNPNLFSEYLTLNLLGTMIQSRRVNAFARGGGISMEFESNRTKQLMSLLLTVAVVGGAMFYAFNAA